MVSSTHPLASKEKVTLAELEKYELALPSKGLQARNAFETFLTTYHHLLIRLELNEMNILLKLIRQTNLVTVLAEDYIYNECDVKAIPIDVPDNDMIGCVHILRDTYCKHSMKEFVRLLNESLGSRNVGIRGYDSNLFSVLVSICRKSICVYPRK